VATQPPEKKLMKIDYAAYRESLTNRFDRDTIEKYIALLHDEAADLTGKLIICALHRDRAGTITHHAIGDADGMVAAIMAHSSTQGANVYCSLSLMRPDLPRGKKGGEADVVAVLGLVADMDADTGKVGVMPIEPSFVIETSPGNTQQVILFDKPMTPTEAKPLAVALQRATSADFGTADISHIWRIPGTLNWPTQKKIKRGRSPEPFLVRLLEGANR
jgi:hypothetical protein